MGGSVHLAADTLVVDSSGEVAINGNLTVKGTVTASSANLGSLSLGPTYQSYQSYTSNTATPSALGTLLAVYDEHGNTVASIDASGSADLAALTTKLITIASSSEASSSATPSGILATSAASNTTAGSAVLVAPNTSLTITSPYVTANSLVYLTPTGETGNKVLFVKAKNICDSTITYPLSPKPCMPSFTVGIDAPATTDISFNWWIIELK